MDSASLNRTTILQLQPTNMNFTTVPTGEISAIPLLNDVELSQSCQVPVYIDVALFVALILGFFVACLTFFTFTPIHRQFGSRVAIVHYCLWVLLLRVFIIDESFFESAIVGFVASSLMWYFFGHVRRQLGSLVASVYLCLWLDLFLSPLFDPIRFDVVFFELVIDQIITGWLMWYFLTYVRRLLGDRVANVHHYFWVLLLLLLLLLFRFWI